MCPPHRLIVSCFNFLGPPIDYGMITPDFKYRVLVWKVSEIGCNHTINRYCVIDFNTWIDNASSYCDITTNGNTMSSGWD